MRLLNLTSHPARELVLLDREGDEWHVVLAKTTWTRAGEVASEQFDVALADEIGEGGALIKPSDVALERTGTSVLCSGAVMAPTARLEVGRVRRPIRAYGERRWERRAGAWTAVEVSPFAPVDARFENAFGGSSGAIRFEENPVGRGFWREASGIDPADIALPLVEDAARPLGAPGDDAPPLSLFPVSRAWSPRRERAGTYDEGWKLERAPLLPEDFDPRAMNVAQDESMAEPFLRGGETFVIENIGRAGVVSGALPRPLLRAFWRTRVIAPCVDVVTFKPEQDRVVLTLRFVCGPADMGSRSEPIVLRTLRHRGRTAA